MMKRSNLQWIHIRRFTIMALLLLFTLNSCEEDSKPLAPYAGPPPLSDLLIEGGTLTPRFNWIGGYVTVFGVNRGHYARLDSTLQWLIISEGNNLHYPIKYGVLPEGAEDITELYGGKFEDFIEDSTYTYWMVKEEGWNDILQHVDKHIMPAITDSVHSYSIDDTLWINTYQHLQKSCWIDAFTNIDMSSIKLRGSFADIVLTETDSCNNVLIDWTIIDQSVQDSLVAAVGLCKAATYDPKKIVWEIWSVDTVDNQIIYGKNNVISPPLLLGQSFPNTWVFKQFPSQGLERNATYLFWVAGKDWDQENHLRFTKYHSYITFNTW